MHQKNLLERNNMEEDNENTQVTGIYSKFSRITLTVLSMLILFAGPTYIPYIMSKVHIDLVVTSAVGGVLFIVGLVFMFWLVKKKIIAV